MEKLDLKKQLKAYYTPSAKEPVILNVPCLQFAAIDGAIEKGQRPGDSPAFQEAVGALYGISYTLKFMLKKRPVDAVDYPVMALEGLWWVEDGIFDITVADNWAWRVMILQPALITQDLFAEAIAGVRKKRGDTPALSRARLKDFEEGPCVQVMHIGPYATEPGTIQRMRDYAAAHGYRDRVGPDGKHHEIYLGDPLRTDPSRLKTVLRHPVEKIE
jgi:hypothetical protein